MRYAVINTDTGLVENVIELADQTDLPENERWRAPVGISIWPSESAGIGWRYVAGTFFAVAGEGPTVAENNAALRVKARAMLLKSDVTIIRCAEHGVAIPDAWRDYRDALRRIIADASTSIVLPVPPAYPAGT